MIKSEIRRKLLNIRKKNIYKNIQANSKKIIFLLKKKFSKLKNVGGYYTSNYEVDDLKILELLLKKDYKISLPSIKKIKRWIFLNGLLRIH